MRTLSIYLGMSVSLLLASSLQAAQQAAPQPAPQPAPQAVYPAKGQTPEQQKKDESECGQWAVKSSGYDPANPPAVATAKPAPVAGSGARVRGAAAGAAVGAVGGNDVGNAAAKGAVVGAVVQRNRNRASASKANEAAAQQQQAAAASYANARQACLEGRGYSVK